MLGKVPQAYVDSPFDLWTFGPFDFLTFDLLTLWLAEYLRFSSQISFHTCFKRQYVHICECLCSKEQV